MSSKDIKINKNKIVVVDGTSIELGQLLKGHIDDLAPYVFDLSKKNLEYIQSLGISSATIASFSLLTLQINPDLLQINHNFLISGFIILILNVVIAFSVCRAWIDIEEKPIKQSLESLKLEQELFLISKQDPELKQNENKERWQEIVQVFKKNRSENDKLAKERNLQDEISKLLSKMIYINLIIFIIGILLLVFAFIPQVS